MFGIARAIIGGRIADAFAQRDVAAHVIVPAIGATLTVPLLIAALLTPWLWISIGFVALGAGIYAGWVGSFYAATLGLVAPESRATASALNLFIINMIGLGFGPLSVGLVSDSLAPGLGTAEGLRWAMIATASIGLIAGGVFWAARGPLRRDTIS